MPSSYKRKPCKSNQIRNPKTGRCVLKNGVIGTQIRLRRRSPSPVRRTSPSVRRSPPFAKRRSPVRWTLPDFDF